MEVNSISTIARLKGDVRFTDKWATFLLVNKYAVMAYTDNEKILQLVKERFVKENYGKRVLVTGQFIEIDDTVFLRIYEMELIDQFFSQSEVLRNYIDFDD